MSGIEIAKPPARRTRRPIDGATAQEHLLRAADVPAGGGVGVLIDAETRRGVLQEDVAHSAVDRALPHHGSYLRGNFMKPAASGL